MKKILVIFLLAGILFSCQRINKDSIFKNETSGYEVEGGGLCYSVEFDGDNYWYFFIPPSSSLPYGELFQENANGKFYSHYEYSFTTIPPGVKEDKIVRIIITSNLEGYVKWEKKIKNNLIL